MLKRSSLWAALLVAGFSFSAQAGSARDYISIVGSSTVFPFSSTVAEQFGKSQPQFKTPKVESTGTGGGIKLFCGGVGVQFPDIANASRRMKPGEFQDCAAKGVKEISEIKFGYDGIVLANAKSAPQYKLSRREIYLALAKQVPSRADPTVLENNPNTTWDQVNPSLPRVKIEVLGPPPTSGTRDAFGELIMTAGCEANPAMKAMEKTDKDKFKAICSGLREDGVFVEAGENDNLIVQKLEANPGTIGIFGFSYLEENEARLKGIAINGVSPSYDSISSFKYPGSRPLYIYVKNAHVRAIPAIKAFVAEFTKETTWGPGGYLVRRGMIAAPDAVRAKNAAAARALTPLDLASIK